MTASAIKVRARTVTAAWGSHTVYEWEARHEKGKATGTAPSMKAGRRRARRAWRQIEKDSGG